MKKLLSICCIFVSIVTYSQDDIELDVLRAPASPASNLIGTSTTDIDKPTDLKSFMLSIQSASNSYTNFPANYAMDFAPYYIFKNGSTDYTTMGLKSDKFKDIWKQTFVISTAITKPDSTNTSLNYNSTYAAIGFKFSIFRGDYSKITDEKLDSINFYQNKLVQLTHSSLEEYLNNNDEEYKNLLKKREDLVNSVSSSAIAEVLSSEEYMTIEAELSAILKNFVKSGKRLEAEDLKSKIQAIASDFQIERTGFSWDVNGGISSEFRKNNFDNSKIYNAGVWTNIGYTTEKGIAFLGLARCLYNPDKIYALDNNVNEYEDTSTLDFGGKIAYSKPQSKFSCSLEAIYRNAFSDIEIDPTWKMQINADYSIFKNQKLTFSFGRDFDETIIKDGNLIAALTFIQGFGK